MIKTTGTIEGQTEYQLEKGMHLVKSIEIDGKKIDFDVILRLHEAVKNDQELIVEIKELAIIYK